MNFIQLSDQRINVKHNGFGWIRLFLAVIVVVSHSNKIGFGTQEPGLAVQDIQGYVTIGSFAVFGFFAISGFLITASYINTQDLTLFLKKRFLRIVPGYWACLALTIVFFVPIYYVLSGKTLTEYFTQDFLKGYNWLWSHIFFETKMDTYGAALDKAKDKALLGQIWTLLYEVRAYILLGIFGLFGVLKNRFAVLVPAVLFWYAHYSIVFTTGYRQWFENWVGIWVIGILFSYFFIASAFYVWKDKISMDWKLFVLSAALVWCGIVIDRFALFAPLFLTYCILYIAHKLPTPKWLEKLGDMSYGVYIYSWLIQNLLVISGFTVFGLLWFNIASVVLSLIAGYLSYHFVEKRFLVRKV
jgi:peptidoglycan/LPS O-acetylase OafA/YrhL